MRTCKTQGENKGRKQQRTRAPLRQLSATAPTRRDTPKGSKTKSPFCVVLKTYHLTGNHHKTCLKHSCFFNRKLCVQLRPTWNTMATPRGQGTEGKTKDAKNELRQGSKHGNYNRRTDFTEKMKNMKNSLIENLLEQKMESSISGSS